MVKQGKVTLTDLRKKLTEESFCEENNQISEKNGLTYLFHNLVYRIRSSTSLLKKSIEKKSIILSVFINLVPDTKLVSARYLHLCLIKIFYMLWIEN